MGWQDIGVLELVKDWKKKELRFHTIHPYKLWSWVTNFLARIESISNLNKMIVGWDKDVGPSFYYLDYIATLHKLEKGGFKYGELDI